MVGVLETRLREGESFKIVRHCQLSRLPCLISARNQRRLGEDACNTKDGRGCKWLNLSWSGKVINSGHNAIPLSLVVLLATGCQFPSG